MSRTPGAPETLNFDQEAFKLFQQLQSRSNRSAYNHADCIWQHPTSGGRLYIGNQTAAQNRDLLKQAGITRIVNCTSDMPNYHEGSPDIEYCNFDISNHWRILDNTEESVTRFITPLFKFIDEALEEGRGVMVHCLAGAHRAGTTGITCYMWKTGTLDAKAATSQVQRLRPIVCPIGTLPQFLGRMEKWLKTRHPAVTGGGGSKA